MSERLSMSLHGVSVRRGDKWVLRDITWQLRAGQRWALVGDNGAGKTQLLKLLSGAVWPTPRGRSAQERRPGGGRQYRLGVPLDLVEAKTRIAYVGAEQQDKYARYGWNLQVRDLVATGLHQTDLLLAPASPSEVRQVAAVLRACGLQNRAGREFLTLSYGEKRLALLARALVRDPDWLLLDEFYNGLDLDFRRRIDGILDAARRSGQAWVATAHRAMDVPLGTRRLLELCEGRVSAVRLIRSSDLQRLAARAHETHIPPRRARKVAATGMVTAAPRAPRRGSLLVRLAHVDLFVDYRAVLRAVNWQLRSGEHWAIFGANGAGKSSFLKLLYGDLSPALGGRIERQGVLPGTPIAAWKKRVGYVSPELQSDYAVNVNLLDLVASGRHASIGLVDAPTAADRRTAIRWVRFFRLKSIAQRRPQDLSYGQLRRALMARAMAANARILLLDEPFTGLDPAQRAIMKRLLERLMPQMTLVIAVHHAEDLPRGIGHALRLHNGRAYPVDSHSAT